MGAYHFLNAMVQRCQEKPWMKLGDTCPYWMGHRAERGHLSFMGDAWFRFYASNSKRVIKRGGKYPPLRGGSEYRHNKLYKLYWKLHPNVIGSSAASSGN